MVDHIIETPSLTVENNKSKQYSNFALSSGSLFNFESGVSGLNLSSNEWSTDDKMTHDNNKITTTSNTNSKSRPISRDLSSSFVGSSINSSFDNNMFDFGELERCLFDSSSTQQEVDILNNKSKNGGNPPIHISTQQISNETTNVQLQQQSSLDGEYMKHQQHVVDSNQQQQQQQQAPPPPPPQVYMHASNVYTYQQQYPPQQLNNNQQVVSPVGQQQHKQYTQQNQQYRGRMSPHQLHHSQSFETLSAQSQQQQQQQQQHYYTQQQPQVQSNFNGQVQQQQQQQQQQQVQGEHIPRNSNNSTPVSVVQNVNGGNMMGQPIIQRVYSDMNMNAHQAQLQANQHQHIQQGYFLPTADGNVLTAATNRGAVQLVRAPQNGQPQQLQQMRVSHVTSPTGEVVPIQHVVPVSGVVTSTQLPLQAQQQMQAQRDPNTGNFVQAYSTIPHGHHGPPTGYFIQNTNGLNLTGNGSAGQMHGAASASAPTTPGNTSFNNTSKSHHQQQMSPNSNGYINVKDGKNSKVWGENNFSQRRGGGGGGNNDYKNNNFRGFDKLQQDQNNRNGNGMEKEQRGRERSDRKSKNNNLGMIDRDQELLIALGTNTPSLSEILENNSVATLSQDQLGCRLLQQKLEEGGPEAATMIYMKAKVHFGQMMVGPFGNYLFQKIIDRVNEEERTDIILLVQDNLVDAALNLHGTRSVQRIVELCRSKRQRDIIVKALRKDTVRLCVDANGNHVVQRALQHMPTSNNEFIFEAVRKSLVEVATHRHGCCVIQRCLDAANTQQRVDLVQEIGNSSLHLMQDPYGNYVVQYVLEVCGRDEIRPVTTCPLGRIISLSVQKFSSNVIEKCIEKATEDVQSAYVDELCDATHIRQLMQDQYANYVIQRALSVANYTKGMQLVDAVKPHLNSMRNTAGGRRIAMKIINRFPGIDLEDDIFAIASSSTSSSGTSSTNSNRN